MDAQLKIVLNYHSSARQQDRDEGQDDCT